MSSLRLFMSEAVGSEPTNTILAIILFHAFIICCCLWACVLYKNTRSKRTNEINDVLGGGPIGRNDWIISEEDDEEEQELVSQIQMKPSQSISVYEDEILKAMQDIKNKECAQEMEKEECIFVEGFQPNQIPC